MPKEGRILCRNTILQYVDVDAFADWEAAVDVVRDEVAPAVLRLMREGR